MISQRYNQGTLQVALVAVASSGRTEHPALVASYRRYVHSAF